MTETLEHTARGIADQGREALLSRLRPAFEEAAAARRDVVTLDSEQLEQMVQRAADRADGLQWRRALAGVATEQLGISLGEALTHPAVVRAHAIVGAPSYEEALGSAPASDETVVMSQPTLAPAAPSEEVAGSSTKDAPPDEAAAPPSPDIIRLRAVHLGGIANLGAGEGDLELQLSRSGLDILREAEQAPLGRISWQEIVALETPEVSGRILRRRRDAQLVIRSRQGSATFEIPGVTPAELREHMAPLLAQQ